MATTAADADRNLRLSLDHPGATGIERQEAAMSALVRRPRLFSLRIDEHPATDGWIMRHLDGTETRKKFEIPLVPTAVPPEALAHGRAFEEWAMDVHGSLGRLLIWDTSFAWWMVHEPDLELLIICAPRGMFREDSDALSWLPFDTGDGHRQVNELRARYGLT